MKFDLVEILVILALAGCVIAVVVVLGSAPTKPFPYFPAHPEVNGTVREVCLSLQCEAGASCEFPSQHDVYWEIHPNGRIEVTYVGGLSFTRGFFDRTESKDRPEWVSNEAGEYLLAMDPAQCAHIIYFPIALEVQQ